MLYYLDTESDITRFFKTTVREAEPLRLQPSYELQYCALSPFHRLMHPFCWLNPGQKAVQVGCTEWMLDFGVSMSMIMSAIVGERGHVLVVEPDPRNIATLTDYVSRNAIGNVDIVEKAAWKEHSQQEFTFYHDRTSSNVITEVQDRARWQNDPDYVGRPTETRVIELDTVDNIVGASGLEVDFVNLTINDAEFEAVQGMTGLMQKGVAIAWLCGGDREWWREAFDFVEDRGYDVVVGNAPYTHRGPCENGKIRMLDPDEVPQELYAVAMPRGGVDRDPRCVPIELSKKRDSNEFEWCEIDPT